MIARACISALLLTFAPPVGAASDVSISFAPSDNCRAAPGAPENCQPVLGCFSNEGIWFLGEARGWVAGEVQVRSSDGLTCRGAFNYRAMIDMGRTVIHCSDGDKIPMSFFNRGEGKSVATGTGISAKGRRVRMWAGNNLPDFLRERRNSDVADIRCGETRIILE